MFWCIFKTGTRLLSLHSQFLLRRDDSFLKSPETKKRRLVLVTRPTNRLSVRPDRSIELITFSIETASALFILEHFQNGRWGFNKYYLRKNLCRKNNSEVKISTVFLPPTSRQNALGSLCLRDLSVQTAGERWFESVPFAGKAVWHPLSHTSNFRA